MGYFAVAIFLLGLLSGLLVRVKTLLPVIVLVLIAAVAACLMSQVSFIWAIAMIAGSQAILQTGYFGGLAIRAVFDKVGRRRLVL